MADGCVPGEQVREHQQEEGRGWWGGGGEPERVVTLSVHAHQSGLHTVVCEVTSGSLSQQRIGGLLG